MIKFVSIVKIVNKKTLNIWHVRLKHLKKQNVKNLVNMSIEMNLIKVIVNKKICELCVVIKIKTNFHKTLVRTKTYFMKLIWSNLIISSIFNHDKKYFVTFFDDFIKRSKIYVLRIKTNTFEVFKNFEQLNEHENARIHRLRIDYEDEYFNQVMLYNTLKHDINWKSIISNTSKQNEIFERLRQTFMQMINIMLKNLNLLNKW